MYTHSVYIAEGVWNGMKTSVFLSLPSNSQYTVKDLIFRDCPFVLVK